MARPIWLELEHGYAVAVGSLRAGKHGFIVLGRRTSPSADDPRPMVASGQFVAGDGRATLTRGMLSESVLRELERRLQIELPF